MYSLEVLLCILVAISAARGPVGLCYDASESGQIARCSWDPCGCSWPSAVALYQASSELDQCGWNLLVPFTLVAEPVDPEAGTGHLSGKRL